MNRRELLSASLASALLAVACAPSAGPSGTGRGSVADPDEPGGSGATPLVDTEALSEALTLFEGSPFEGAASGLAEAVAAALEEVAAVDPTTAEVLSAYIAVIALPRFEAAHLAQGAFDEGDLIVIEGAGLDVDASRLEAALDAWAPTLEEQGASSVQEDLRGLVRDFRACLDTQGTLTQGYAQRACAELDSLIAALEHPTSELIAEANAGIAALVAREDFNPGPAGPPSEECDDSAYAAAQNRAVAAIALSYIGMIRLVAGLSGAGPLGMLLGLMTLAIGIPLMVGSMTSIYERAYIRMCSC